MSYPFQPGNASGPTLPHGSTQIHNNYSGSRAPKSNERWQQHAKGKSFLGPSLSQTSSSDDSSTDRSSPLSVTFSPVSSASSVSSISSWDNSQSTRSEANVAKRAIATRRNHLELQGTSGSRRRIQGLHSKSISSQSNIRSHPRRTIASANWNVPTLQRQFDQRQIMVELLCESAEQLVIMIWPASVLDRSRESSNSKVITLRHFIKETLRRSRTSYSTLQVTFWYLILIKAHIPDHVHRTPNAFDREEARLCCGRRMFVAALMLASKWVQDRSFKTRAWSKITGLSPAELNANEYVFLERIDFRLHISKQDYEDWNLIVTKSTYRTAQHHQNPCLWWTRISNLFQQGMTVGQVLRDLHAQQLMVPNITTGSSVFRISSELGREVHVTRSSPAVGGSNSVAATQEILTRGNTTHCGSMAMLVEAAEMACIDMRSNDSAPLQTNSGIPSPSAGLFPNVELTLPPIRPSPLRTSSGNSDDLQQLVRGQLTATPGGYLCHETLNLSLADCQSTLQTLLPPIDSLLSWTSNSAAGSKRSAPCSEFDTIKASKHRRSCMMQTCNAEANVDRVWPLPLEC